MSTQPNEDDVKLAEEIKRQCYVSESEGNWQSSFSTVMCSILVKNAFLTRFMKEHIKHKIISFLQSKPKISHRRTPWNIAGHIGEKDSESLVRQCLEELVKDGVIKHRLAKNMAYWI